MADPSFYSNPTSSSSGFGPIPPPKPGVSTSGNELRSQTSTPVVPPLSQLQQQSMQQSYQQPYRHDQQPPVPPHPVPLQSQQPPVPPHPSQIRSLPSQDQAQSSSVYHSPPPVPQQSHPSAPAPFALPESIVSKSTTELSRFLNQPELLRSFATTHPSYAASLTPLHEQIARNTALAQQVIDLEAQVKRQREQTGQLILQHASLMTQWRRKQREMDEALEPWGPRAMYQRLVAGIAEQEALVRAMKESFGEEDGVASEREVGEWVRRVREGTLVLEKRKEMKARWDEGRVGGWR